MGCTSSVCLLALVAAVVVVVVVELVEVDAAAPSVAAKHCPLVARLGEDGWRSV